MAISGTHRVTAWAIGIVGTLVTAAVFFALPNWLPTTLPALVLLVPICASSVLAGSRVGVTVAVFAALVYCLAFIPPIGGINVGLTADLYVLIAFVVVAVFVGYATGRHASPGRDKLLDSDRAMLLRSVSHDLRSPLSTIHSVSTELLDNEAYDERTQRELMGVVASEAARLNRIVGNLLSISRVQAGSFEPAIERTPVAELVDAAVARVPSHLDLTVESLIDDSTPDVLADPVQIDQVLANLLENSIRHAPPGSWISVDARRSGKFVRISVSDEGPGFSPAALGRLLGDGPTRPAQPNGAGSGLGLTVCRAIVEAHQGQIEAQDPKRGAVVGFTLPIAPGSDLVHSPPGNMAET